MSWEWAIRGQRIVFQKTLIMGILNLTPDSFSDGGKFFVPEKALEQAKRLEREGADILDIGAESTRPGASPVSEKEELDRILPCLEKILKEVKLPVSIDTTKPAVAKICLEKGAHIINDVSGLRDSGEEMAGIVKGYAAGLVLMHRRGNPETMQGLARYDDVVEEVIRELAESIAFALRCGIKPEQLVIDPGIGFAKDAEQNIEIIKNLEQFQRLGRPVLLGPSRKAFLGALTGQETGAREIGTAAVCALAVERGAAILRVHETAAARDAARVAEAMRGEKHVRA